MNRFSFFLLLAVLLLQYSNADAVKSPKQSFFKKPVERKNFDPSSQQSGDNFLKSTSKSRAQAEEESSTDTSQMTRLEVIEKIYEKVLTKQIQEGEFMSPADDPGLFKSEATIHVVDEENSEALHNFRQRNTVPYNIAFNSTLVLMDLFELERLGLLTLDDDSMALAWDAMLNTRSKNFPDGTAIFNFSGQTPYFGSFGRLSGYNQPIPLNNEINLLWDVLPPPIREAYYEKTNTVLTARVRMPPDADSTSLVLIAVSMAIENDRESEKEKVLDQIKSFNALSERLTKATYRPFANWDYDPDAIGTGAKDPRDIIDSRSYYTLHPFFKKKYEAAIEAGEKPDVRVIDSWLINQDEIIPEIMELILINANETDSVVYFSFIRGITHILLKSDDLLGEMGQSDFFTEDLQQLYLNSGEAMHWMVSSGMMKDHPDIISMYPTMEIPYNHVAKLLQWLRVFPEDDIPYDVIITVRDLFIEIVEDYWTQDILDVMIIDDDAEEAYCDGILGAYNGKSWEEDRLYTTAFQVESLVSFWTVRNEDGSLSWIDGVSDDVKKIAKYAGNYVKRVVLDDDTSLQGCLYATGEASVDDQPYRFPVNVHEYLNGTVIDPHDTDLTTVDLVNLSWNVQGYIDDTEYQNMVENEVWFQKKTSTEFRGFNNPENSNSFYYFFSEALTLSHSAVFLGELELLGVEESQ